MSELPLAAEIAFILVSAGWAVFEHMDARRQRKRAERAEDQLAQNRRLEHGPHLKAQELKIGHYVSHDYGPERPFPPAGVEAKLQLTNTGARVDEVTDDWPDGQGIDTDEIETKAFCAGVSYIFDPARVGHQMPWKLRFLSKTGEPMHHLYHITHGRPEIKRIDPP